MHMATRGLADDGETAVDHMGVVYQPAALAAILEITKS
jgi:hypothetical protein